MQWFPHTLSMFFLLLEGSILCGVLGDAFLLAIYYQNDSTPLPIYAMFFVVALLVVDFLMYVSIVANLKHRKLMSLASVALFFIMIMVHYFNVVGFKWYDFSFVVYVIVVGLLEYGSIFVVFGLLFFLIGHLFLSFSSIAPPLRR